MIDIRPHLDALDERIAVVELLIDESHPLPPRLHVMPREARGLAIVLLFAAYEDLLTSLTRTLLEAAIRMRVSNRRLQPGFRTFALADTARSVRHISEKKIYSSALRKIVDVTSSGDRACTINPDAFPSDGSYMKRSQIKLWAEIFAVGEPHIILYRTWASIDSIVTGRNAVAHGVLTPQEIGRNYTETEIRVLTENWHCDWADFLRHIEAAASTRDFFRLPR